VGGVSSRPTIVFIHGMYLNRLSWQPWVDRAAARGFDAIVPCWPFHDGPPAVLRDIIPPQLGLLTFGDVISSLKEAIGDLPERPLLVGHSIGGLAVQKLLGDGYGRAGVAISSAPPQGVMSFAPDFFRANWPHINPFAGNRPIRMTKARFHYTFCTTMTRAESDAAFDELVVPESRNVPRSTLTSQAHVDFAVDHLPLLMLAGDTDHLTPEALVRKNAARYRRPVEVRSFAGRAHFICNQPGWEEVADATFEWLDLHR
jgi:alpha-beta hydrolase superfamily lysophospholipase